MEFINNFTDEQIEIIIKNATEEGYKAQVTKWLDSWEREEGCPSECYYDLEEFISNGYSLDYEKCGCSELNFVKDNEYINFYHIEANDKYICDDALVFLY